MAYAVYRRRSQCKAARVSTTLLRPPTPASLTRIAIPGAMPNAARERVGSGWRPSNGNLSLFIVGLTLLFMHGLGTGFLPATSSLPLWPCTSRRQRGLVASASTLARLILFVVRAVYLPPSVLE
ncbi:hypothetical protein DFH06DRAFT_1123864 [Mycena polygramma]|nr:hypothetical protein DFH06DRAFT_1123864 [Mycena polygramma]